MANTQVRTVSIIIPIHQGGEYFRRCVSSVAQLSPAPMEVIVVADGEIGQDAGLVQEFSFNLIQLPLRQGPACARNVGAREAKGELLFFVDADVVVPRDALELVFSAFEQGPKVAAVFGSYDDEPAASSFLSQYRNLLHHYVHQSANPEASTFWAGCGVIRRDLFLKLGGFDERYGVPAIEDIELGHRLRLARCRVLLLKTLQVKHLKHWGAWSLVTTDFFQRAIPWSRLILRSRWMINDLNLRIGSRLSVILIFGLLGCLLLAPFSLKQAEIAAVLVAALVSLNLPIILFFLKKRGIWFAVRAIPWLWFYYFYSGLAFVIETARFGCQTLKGLLIKKTLTAPCPHVEDHTEAR